MQVLSKAMIKRAIKPLKVAMTRKGGRRCIQTAMIS